MSDTDTDDTDLLLLIPPNYYTDTADRLMREIKMNAAVAHENAAADALAMPPPPAPTTAAYQFLMPSKKTERFARVLENLVSQFHLGYEDQSQNGW